MDSEERLINKGRLGNAQKRAKELAIEMDIHRKALRSQTERHERFPETFEQGKAVVALNGLVKAQEEFQTLVQEIKALKADLGED